jgi:hypothetical protein
MGRELTGGGGGEKKAKKKQLEEGTDDEDLENETTMNFTVSYEKGEFLNTSVLTDDFSSLYRKRNFTL